MRRSGKNERSPLEASRVHGVDVLDRETGRRVTAEAVSPVGKQPDAGGRLTLAEKKSGRQTGARTRRVAEEEDGVAGKLEAHARLRMRPRATKISSLRRAA